MSLSLPVTDRFNAAMFYLGLFMILGTGYLAFTQHEEYSILKIKIMQEKEDIELRAESMSNIHDAYTEAISDLKIIHLPDSCKYSVESANSLKTSKDEVSFDRALGNFSRWTQSCLDTLSSLTQEEMRAMKESELRANEQSLKFISKMIEEQEQYTNDSKNFIVETEEFMYRHDRLKYILFFCVFLATTGAVLTVLFGNRWFKEQN